VSGVIPTVEPLPGRLPSRWLSSAFPMMVSLVTTVTGRRMSSTLASWVRMLSLVLVLPGLLATHRPLRRVSRAWVIAWLLSSVRKEIISVYSVS
jgi:hypothetical protein